MKRTLLAFTLAIFLVIAANAQQKKPAAIQYYSKEVLNEINATPQQHKAIKALMDQSQKDVRAIKSDESLSQEDKNVAVKKIVSERAKAYWALLTPEQTKYLQDKKKKLAEDAN